MPPVQPMAPHDTSPAHPGRIVMGTILLQPHSSNRTCSDFKRVGSMSGLNITVKRTLCTQHPCTPLPEHMTHHAHRPSHITQNVYTHHIIYQTHAIHPHSLTHTHERERRKTACFSTNPGLLIGCLAAGLFIIFLQSLGTK